MKLPQRSGTAKIQRSRKNRASGKAAAACVALPDAETKNREFRRDFATMKLLPANRPNFLSHLFFVSSSSAQPSAEMRATQALLGGGRRFFYPRYVFTPAGGWWGHEPANADSNIRWVWMFMGVAIGSVFTFSIEKEVSMDGPKGVAIASGTRCIVPRSSAALLCTAPCASPRPPTRRTRRKRPGGTKKKRKKKEDARRKGLRD